MTYKSIGWWRAAGAWTLAMVAWTSSWSNAWADKPVALVTLAPLDELFEDIKYFTDAIGVGDAGRMVTGMGSAYVEGWDRSQPIGVMVSVDDQDQIKPMVFLPIKDLKAALKPLEAQLGKPRDAGGGVQELQGPQPIFLKQQGGWVYLAQSAEALAELPANVSETLAPLNKSYDISVRGFVQNVPQSYKDMAISQIEEGMNGSLVKQSEESDEAFENRKKMAETQLEQFKQFFTDSDQLTVGLNIDTEAKNTTLDGVMTTVPGTKMHRQIMAAKDTKTNFAGFVVPNATAQMVASSKLAPEEIPQTIEMLNNARDSALKQLETDSKLPDEKSQELAKRLVTDLMGLVEATLKTGRMDLAGSVSLEPGAVNAVLGGYLVDANKLEGTLRELAKLAESEPDFPPVKFNADKHKNVAFHTISIPVPAEDEKARAAFGEKVDVALGLDKQAVYVAVGPDGMKLVKSAIDQSASKGAQPTDASTMTVSLLPILNFAKAIEPNPGITAAISAIEEASGKDKVRVTGKVIENGAEYRLHLDEGVLKAIGEGVKMSQGGGF